MKNLFLIGLVLVFTAGCSFAQVGYVDYNRINSNFALAKKYNQTIKQKQAQIMTYAQEKDKQANNASSTAEKRKIREEGIAQVELKNKEVKSLKRQYDNEINNRVRNASETVRIRKGLDIIIRNDQRITGGVDCTNEVLEILKN